MCPSSCDEDYEVSFSEDVRINEPKANIQVIHGPNKVEDAMLFLQLHGSFRMSLGVWNEFFAYNGGVLKKISTGPELGSHAVRVIGWGTENGDDYWLCVNSWGTGWGVSGTFKIARGVNEMRCEHRHFYGVSYECDAGQVVNEFGRCEDVQSVFFYKLLCSLHLMHLVVLI